MDNEFRWLLGRRKDEYHVEDLNQLIKAVDYISLHSYRCMTRITILGFYGEYICRNEKIDAAMARARDYAIGYKSVANYKVFGRRKAYSYFGETGCKQRFQDVW
jgi:hypothetical protein